MNLLPVSVLYTQDPDLARKVNAYLKFLAMVRHVDRPEKLETVLQQFDPTLLLMDLRAEDWRALLGRILKNLPQSLVIALGLPRSDPALEAEAMGVYAVEDARADRQRIQSLVTRGNAHLRLVRENRILKADSVQTPHEQEATGAKRAGEEMISMPFYHFSRAFRHFDNVEAMLESMVEGIVTSVKVSRVGIFSIARGSNKYRLRAGIKCLDNTREFAVSEDDPLARWMQINAHLVSRSKLRNIEDPSERMLLEQSLDSLGAEVIIPLHGRERVVGWLFVGRSTTGVPWEQADLDRLSVLGDDISLALENALLYEEVAVQKNLAETVLHAIPVGIVACDSSGLVSWFNAAAERILGLERNAVLNGPVATVGGAPR